MSGGDRDQEAVGRDADFAGQPVHVAVEVVELSVYVDAYRRVDQFCADGEVAHISKIRPQGAIRLADISKKTARKRSLWIPKG